mmetsp:Transcript_39959/g.89604  ORF Transcript_39959/g.89604 Transcript_39959/m.89604 type:complete len:282 (+) Transcript_39959:188-1033(+)
MISMYVSRKMFVLARSPLDLFLPHPEWWPTLKTHSCPPLGDLLRFQQRLLFHREHWVRDGPLHVLRPLGLLGRREQARDANGDRDRRVDQPPTGPPQLQPTPFGPGGGLPLRPPPHPLPLDVVRVGLCAMVLQVRRPDERLGLLLHLPRGLGPGGGGARVAGPRAAGGGHRPRPGGLETRGPARRRHRGPRGRLAGGGGGPRGGKRGGGGRAPSGGQVRAQDRRPLDGAHPRPRRRRRECRRRGGGHPRALGRARRGIIRALGCARGRLRCRRRVTDADAE